MNSLPINKIFLAGFAFVLTHWKKIIEASVIPVLLSMPLFFIIIDPTFFEILSKIVDFSQKEPLLILLNNAEFIQLASQLPESMPLYLLLSLYAQIVLSINMYRLVIQGEESINGLIPIFNFRKIIKFFGLMVLVGLATSIFSGSILQMIVSFLIVPITLNFVRISIDQSFQYKWNLSFPVQVNLFFIQMILPLVILLLLIFIDNHLGAGGMLATTLFVMVFFYWVPITLALCYRLIQANNSEKTP
jgi:hypothetical protein